MTQLVRQYRVTLEALDASMFVGPSARGPAISSAEPGLTKPHTMILAHHIVNPEVHTTHATPIGGCIDDACLIECGGRAKGDGPTVAKTFVGFGFGPIQSGLFLFEAFKSGSFDRLVVSEVDADLVDAVRRCGGRYVVNVAHQDRIEAVVIEGVELLNPTVADDRDRLVEAVRGADEMATALPSVDFYDRGGTTSVVSLLAEGCTPGTERIIYAAENNNYAAEILRDCVARHSAAFPFEQTAILDTVIGKMSQVVSDLDDMSMAPMVDNGNRAILVEAFNRILVSKITVPGCTRGIEVFEEKEDLLPFEEAKLYGHNAIHALMAYLGAAAGYSYIAELRRDETIMAIARRAFLDESGVALCRRHAALNDPLFTSDGYRAYADDLLDRMTNPNLNDAIARVARDPARKLSYSDRLFGTMRVALDQDTQPTNLAAGAAAGVLFLLGERGHLTAQMPRSDDVARVLAELWQDQETDAHKERLVQLIGEAMPAVWALHRRGHT